MTDRSSRGRLRAIARRVMVERGLEPDFSPAAQAETAALRARATEPDLASLNEGEERLALVVDMTVAGDGSVTASNVYRAVVHNKAKLAYNSVGAWLEGIAPAPPKVTAVPGLEEQLRTQDRAAQAMK